MGSAFMFLLAGFMVGLFFIAFKNFNSDVDVLDSTQTRLKTISPVERELIDEWLKSGAVEVPPGTRYRTILKDYPSKPWLHTDENTN